MSTCVIGEPCVTQVMSLIEANPQPFILEEEPVFACQGKLCEAVQTPVGEFQGPPIEYMFDEGELLSFIFSNEFPPTTNMAPVPLPTSGLLLAAVLLAAFGYKKLKSL